MCGAIRRPVEFLFTVGELARLKAEGRLDEIVLSTWRGEIDAHDGLRDRLLGAGLILIESDPPADLGAWNIFGQHKALTEGLDVCPDDCFVFKHRTDKAYGGTWAFAPFLEADLPETFGPGAVFRHKIVCSNYSTTAPLYLADFCFLGHIDDVRQLVNFDRRYDSDFLPSAAMILPEMRWFLHPFLSRSRRLDWWIRKAPVIETSRAIMNYAKAGAAEPLPSVARDVLALNLAFLRANFLTMLQPDCADAGDPINLFCEPEPGYPALTPVGSGWTMLMNIRLVDDFLAGLTKAKSPHIADIANWANGDIQALMRRMVTPEEAAELAAFLDFWNPQGARLVRPSAVEAARPAAPPTHMEALGHLRIWQALEIEEATYWRLRGGVEHDAGGMGVSDALMRCGVACLERNEEMDVGRRLLGAAADLQSIPAGFYLIEQLLRTRPEGWREDAMSRLASTRELVLRYDALQTARLEVLQLEVEQARA